MSVINVANNTIFTIIDGFDGPYDVVIRPQGDYAYVSNIGNNAVIVIDVNPASPDFNMIIVGAGLGYRF